MVSPIMKLPILFEDNHLLVVNKPAGWVSQGALPGHASVVEEAAQYLKQKYQKPGNVFVGIVSRLDSPASGVLPLARTSKCASRLSEQFRDRTVEKIYWVVVEGKPPQSESCLEHWLVRHPDESITRVARSGQTGAQRSTLHYTTLAETPSWTLLRVVLETGRKHQIRSQMSAIGCPIVGDHRYGSSQNFGDWIGLHCRSLTFAHPISKLPQTLVAAIPIPWDRLSPPSNIREQWNFDR